MFKEFKAFAMRGNVVDIAVGLIIGAASGAIVKSLVDDVIMPPVGLALGNADFSNMFIVLKPGVTAAPYASVADAQAAGAVTMNYGLLVNAIVSFIIVAFAVFMLIRMLNRLQNIQPADAVTKDCPRCYMAIPVMAKRCPHCTSDL